MNVHCICITLYVYAHNECTPDMSMHNAHLPTEHVFIKYYNPFFITLIESSLLHNDRNHLNESLELAIDIATKVNQTQNVSNLLQMRTELATQQVRVGFVGMMKVGKSTTLNAILHKRILPSAVQAETAVKVSIRHVRNVPDGVLIGEQNKKNVTKEIAKGVSNISNALWHINKQKRSKQESYKAVRLNVSFPFLSNHTKNFSMTIFDTPGTDEAVVDSSDIDTTIHDLAAFVVVLDYRKMKSDGEISLLKRLKQQHQTIFNSSERLLFILNHINTFDEHRAVQMENSIKPLEAPRFVADYLKELLQVNISPDQVIPYSAKWALESRICLDNPSQVDDGIMEEAQLILRNQGQSDGDDGGSNNIVARCKTLEKYSNILTIENRLIQLFVEYGHKVIERDIAEKVMENLNNLLSTIDWKIVELGVPAKNETLLHQKHVLSAVKQTIVDVPYRLRQPLDMLRTPTLTNMSSTWIDRIVSMTDIILNDLDACFFDSYKNSSIAVQKAKNDFNEKVMPKIKQAYNDMVYHHKGIASLHLQQQWNRLMQELSLIFGNKKLTYPLPNLADLRIPSPSLPTKFRCNIQDINIADVVRAQSFNISSLSTGIVCSALGCADKERTLTLYAVKTLTLKNIMTESLDRCFKTVESTLTEYLDLFSSSVNQELINSIENWWKSQQPIEDANLQNIESKLQEAIRQKVLLDGKRTNLEDALQNVMRILSNAT